MPVPKIKFFSEKFWWNSLFCLVWKNRKIEKKLNLEKNIWKTLNFWNFFEFQMLIFDKKNSGKSWILVKNSSKVLVVLTS